MRIWRALGRIGLASLVLCAAVIEIARPGADSAANRTPEKSNIVIKTVVLTLIAVLVLISAGGLLFVLSGVYPLEADKPHYGIVRSILQLGRTRSVQLHSTGIHVPNLREGSLIKTGFALYRINCQPCHGAPGVGAEQIGLGINPKPPQLVTTSADWSDAEIYWIVSHGLKMSGMPAFAPRLSDTDRWGIVAFLRRLGRLSPAEYQGLIAAADRGIALTGWGADDDQGFAEIGAGNPQIGKRLMGQYGCAACHTIPGIGIAYVGPPLTAFAERQYIAGSIVNLPTNAMNWIMNPKKCKPNTAMPVLGVKPHEAVDIAAYLFKLGSRKRIDDDAEHQRSHLKAGCDAHVRVTRSYRNLTLQLSFRSLIKGPP